VLISYDQVTAILVELAVDWDGVLDRQIADPHLIRPAV
jgi:hypothetical protein